MSLEPEPEIQNKSYLFTSLGFRSLCSQVPLEDLLQYRLVCREWNEIVEKEKKFKKSKVTFKPDWIQNDLMPFFGSSLQSKMWENVKLYRTKLPTTSAHLYLTFWKKSCEPLKILDVYRIPVTYEILCKIINLSPNLEEIVLNHVRFPSQDNKRTDLQADRFGQQRNTEHIDRSFCPSCLENEHHADTLEKIFNGSGDPLCTRSSIKKIKILGFFTIPCAILQMLGLRSRGGLVELKIIKWFGKPKKVNGNLTPSVGRQRTLFLGIIRGSEESLDVFHFVDNEALDSSLLFTSMVPLPAEPGDQVVIPNLQLKELELKKGLDRRQNHHHHFNQNGQTPIGFNQRAMTLIRNQAASVLKLKLTLALGDQFDDFHTLMTNVTIIQTLQSFEFNFIGVVNPRPVMTFLGNLRVSHLVLCDSRKPVSRNFVNNFNHEGFNTLPRLTSLKLRLLNLNHGEIGRILSNHSLTVLTSLEILCTKSLHFCDASLILIIDNMPKLKKLHIHNSGSLSEVGITGLRHEVIVELDESKIFHGKPSDYDENVVQINLRQLQDLEDLSLKGCNAHVGNVTLFFGSLLTNLKKLDLSECSRITDNGIQFVGKYPKMEHLIIRQCPKLTFYGINQLVMDCRHITTIHTSNSTIKRKLQKAANNEEHPFFSQVVKSYSEVIREAKMENKDRRPRNGRRNRR